MDSAGNSEAPGKTFYLLGSAYDGAQRKAFLKFLDDESGEVSLNYDESGHKPYCYSKLDKSELSGNSNLKQRGVIRFETITKDDLLREKKVELSVIYATDPLAVGGRKDSIREIIEAWEADIPYHLNYLYDRQLVPGMPYRVHNSDMNPVTAAPDYVEEIVSTRFGHASFEEKAELKQWLLLLEAEQPRIKHVCLDIEVISPVATRVPSPSQASDPVVAVSLASSDGMKQVFLLRRQSWPQEMSSADFKIKMFASEKDLLLETFGVLQNYPVVATYNGDDFDLPYLRNRAEKIGLTYDQIPITLGREGASLKRGVHLDLYRFFLNKSIQIYAFDNKYRENTLEGVSQEILGRGKVPIQKPISELAPRELAEYSFGDALLVDSLMSFSNNLVIRLMIVLCRISKMPIEDVCRHGVSGWIRNLLYYEHRRRSYLIPRPEEILEEKGTTSTKAVIDGKKYRGAIVVEPVPGIHFNVTVLDFASLYPSALKHWNLSYETIRCVHPECRVNLIPETGHWVCTKRKGMQSLLIGSLRDIRVDWYKPKSLDNTLERGQRDWYSAVQKALKVFLNASYGVFGAEMFPLYCPPVAESTAAIGRFAFTEAIKAANSLGIDVVYGDTVSGDAELFVRRRDLRTRMTMKEFYEMERSRNGSLRRGEKEYVPCSSDIGILTLRKEGKISWSKPRFLVSHLVPKWFEVTTYTGRRIRVTHDHSLYTLRDMRVVPVKVAELKKGDYIAVPRAFPPSHSLTEVRLTEFREMLGQTMLRDGQIVLARNSESALPMILPLDIDITWFLGLWLGDGSYDGENGVDVTVFDKALQQRVVRLASRFGISPLIDEKKGVRLPSRLLFRVMRHVLGLTGDSHTKRLPSWYMSLPNDTLLELLKGLFQADGNLVYTEGRFMGVKLDSRSESLVRDMQAALLRFGVVGYVRCYRDVNPYTEGFTHRLVVSGQNGRRLARLLFDINVPEPRNKDSNDIIPLSEKDVSEIVSFLKKGRAYREWAPYLRSYRHSKLGRRVSMKVLNWLDEGETKNRLRSLVRTHVLWDEVVEMKRLTRPELGFDINVPETQNFVVSNIIAHNTDSIFLRTNRKELVDKLIGWAKEKLNLDLEFDKVYKYAVFSTRKKNYLGVTLSGQVDVKGLTGKKRHIPNFIKDAFNEMLDTLAKVESPDDFEKAKMKIQEIIKGWYHRLKKGEFKVEDLSFNVMLSRQPERYVKTTPQHVKAAKKLGTRGVQISAGDIISFVKTKDRDGVEPVRFAKVEQIDTEKYIEYLESTFEQVLDALELDFNTIIGVSSLESFLN